MWHWANALDWTLHNRNKHEMKHVWHIDICSIKNDVSLLIKLQFLPNLYMYTFSNQHTSFMIIEFAFYFPASYICGHGVAYKREIPHLLLSNQVNWVVSIKVNWLMTLWWCFGSILEDKHTQLRHCMELLMYSFILIGLWQITWHWACVT